MKQGILIASLLALGAWTTPLAARERPPLPKVEQVEKGRTTYDEAVSKFGPPQFNTVAADGSRYATYYRARTHIKGASFVPIIGMFAGGMNVGATTISLIFGPDGVLKDVTTTDTQMDSRNGH